jgi:hypothetical protein
VALLSGGPLLLVAKKSIPANSLVEFIGSLKSNPCKATAA